MAQVSTAGAWQQGKDTQFDECLVLACYPVGMDGEKSDQKRTAEREAHASSRRFGSRRDHCTSRKTSGASSNRLRARRVHRASAWRTDWIAVAGRGFREPCNSRSPFGRPNGGGGTEDRSFCKRRPSRCSTRRIVAEIETRRTLQQRYGLGFRFGDDEGQTAFMAGDAVAPLRASIG